MSLIIGTSLCGALDKKSERIIVSVSHDGQTTRYTYIFIPMYNTYI